MNEIKKERLDSAIRRKRVRTGIIFAVSAIIVGGIAFWGFYYMDRAAEDLPGQSFPNQGQEHVTTTNHPAYNSNPPTSGWHYPKPAEWGAYKQEIPDEILIHNLEHGGIWISYKPGISQEVIEKLEDLQKKWGRKVIVAPRSANDTDIALAAWTRLDKFSVSEFSDERAEKFIKAFRNKGPEFVP